MLFFLVTREQRLCSPPPVAKHGHQFIELLFYILLEILVIVCTDTPVPSLGMRLSYYTVSQPEEVVAYVYISIYIRCDTRREYMPIARAKQPIPMHPRPEKERYRAECTEKKIQFSRSVPYSFHTLYKQLYPSLRIMTTIHIRYARAKGLKHDDTILKTYVCNADSWVMPGSGTARLLRTAYAITVSMGRNRETLI